MESVVGIPEDCPLVELEEGDCASSGCRKDFCCDGKYASFRGYYHIELDRIKDEGDLLAWILHLGQKAWMKTDVMTRFVEAVCEIKKFNSRIKY